MNRQASKVSRLGAVLVIAGLVTVACGRGAAGTEPPSAGQPSNPPAVATASPAAETPAVETPEVSLAPDASTSGSPSDGASPSPAPTYAPPAAANDPVNGDLSQIDQLIQNVDSSISGSNAGGE